MLFRSDQSSTRLQLATYPGTSGRPEEELFITSPTSDQQPPPPRPAYNTQHIAQHIATTGYQTQYQQSPQHQQAQTPTTYNPQTFARAQSTSLPYHPHPASRYAGPVSPTYPSPPTNYTPQAYNPAAYANTNSSLPHRQATVAGYNNYSYSYSPPAVPQSSSTYGQTPGPSYSTSQPAPATAASSQPAYEPALQSPQYTPSALSPQYDQSYSSLTYGGQQYYASQASNGASPNPSSAYSTPTTQAPYPAFSQMPVGPGYSASDPNSYVNRTSRSNSHESPVPSSPAQPPSASPGLQRHPTNAPLPSRPMENVPEEPSWRSGGRGDDDGQVTQESLIQDIVSDLGVAPPSHRSRTINGSMSEDELDKLRRYNSTASTANASSSSVSVGRYASNASTVNRNDVPTTHNQWGEDDEDRKSVV